MSAASNPKTVVSITNKKQYEEFCQLHRGQTICALFSAAWSEPCKQLIEVLAELDGDLDHSRVVVCTLEAESLPEVALQFNIVAVPTLVFIKDGQRQIERVNGAYPAEVVKKVTLASNNQLNEVQPAQISVDRQFSYNNKKEDLQQRLKNLTSQSRVVLFMKGSPDAPQCGFSKTTVTLLRSLKTEFTHFDILSDQEVREALKKYSNWPTYPQLYVEGKLVGGLDILKEMHELGELESLLVPANTAQNGNTSETGTNPKDKLNERLRSLVTGSSVMVFMKGNPDAPKCKFSKALMQLLKETGVKFDTFDILEDNEVREGLKTFSDWPTYPQIYVNGKLIGGLDILQELKETDELVSALQAK